MDKSAETHEYIGKVEKHASQKDYSTGFGGKFGVQSDRKDSSAVGWDHIEKVDKHESQKGRADKPKHLNFLILCVTDCSIPRV